MDRAVACATQLSRRSERCRERLNPALALALAELHFELDHIALQLIKARADETFFSAPLTTEHLFRNIYFTVDPRDRRM